MMAKKVMIVDDDEGILDALKAIYLAEGYEVCTDSQNGKSIYSKLRNIKPDLIVLDVFLSEMDGRNIVKELKANKETADIPIVMTSARQEVKKSALKCGASYFLPKPFDVDKLLDTSEKLMN